MASPDVEVFRCLDAALSPLGVRWYVFGAQAAIIHGAARFTQDIDVTVLLDAVAQTRLVDALTASGFELRIADKAFIDQTRVLPTVHTQTSIPVDVVLGGPGLEELFAGRAQRTDVGGAVVPVALLEDVVAMKVLAGRPKDLDDVVALSRTRAADLDASLVRETLTLIESALDQSDLLPSFQQCLARAKRR